MSSVGNAVDEIVALGENSADIYGQQVALGHWIAATLPADARIAINDAGAMKYYGGRYMYDLVGLTTNGLAGLRHLGDGPIYNWLTALPPAQRPNYFIIYPDWFPDLSALPGFLTAVHSVHLPHNTIASEADVPVYEVHWDALRAAPQPQLDHSADDVEVPSGKVVFTGAPGPGPYYLAHLALTTAQTVTLRLEPDAGAQLDYVDLAEDISGYTVRLPAGHGGSQISQTISLPAGSYRLSAGGHFGPGAGVIVRLLTPGPLLGLPGHTPAPPRRLVDEVDLGNLASEAAHDYTMDPWQWNIYPEAILRSATYTSQPATPYVDTGRSVPGAQEFTVATQPGQPLQVVLRYLSAVPQRVQVQVDGQDAGLWYYPAAAGWGEAQLLLPARLIQHAQTRLRFAVLQDPADTPMQSFRFWFYQ